MRARGDAEHREVLLASDGTPPAPGIKVLRSSMDLDPASSCRQRARVRVLACAFTAVAVVTVAGLLVPRRCCGPPLLESPLPSVSEVKAAMAGLSACAVVVQSARDSPDRLSRRACQPFQPDFAAPRLAVIDLTAADMDQEIVGFGGAFTESAALVFQALNPELRRRFVRAYFSDPDEGGSPWVAEGLEPQVLEEARPGREEVALGVEGGQAPTGISGGIGYTIGRVHINSCDFSVNSYSFDDVAEDFALDHFDEDVAHDARTMIPLIHEAQAAAPRPLRLVASPWSPPAWMKTSGKMDGSDKPGLRADCHDVWARYVSRWISAYAKQGVPIWGMTMQNEPENPAAWEACVFSPEEGAQYVRHFLGPTLRKDHPEVKIFAFDHNKDHLFEWANASFLDPDTSSFFDGIAFHWYSGDEFDHVRSVRQAWPDKLLLPSEATYEKYRWHKGVTLEKGDWRFGEGYAHDIIGDLNEGAVGWLDWNLLLDEHGGPNHLGNDCDAAVMANVTAQKLYFHPQFFYIGHISKYVPPGSRRLTATVTLAPGPYSTSRPTGRPYGTCGPEDGLESASFLRPDGQVAVVVLNCGDAAVPYKVRKGDLALAMTIPGHAIQTLLFPNDLSNATASAAAGAPASDTTDEGAKAATATKPDGTPM